MTFRADRLRGRLARMCRLVAVCAVVLAGVGAGAGLGPQPVWAQTTAPQTTAPQTTAPQTDTPQTDMPQVDATGALLPREGAVGQVAVSPAPVTTVATGVPAAGETTSLDYAAWERMAARAEKTIADPAITTQALELLRGQLVDWRAALLGAQSANSARIATLRTQIAALGPAPAAGQVEAEEIAKRRSELTDQLVRLQAPGIAAVEAYQRADGLIREIDRSLREQQANRLLQLWPMPINPANWPEAGRAVAAVSTGLWTETAKQIGDPAVRTDLVDKLPVILVLLVLAVVVLWRGRRWLDVASLRLNQRMGARGQRVWAFVVSLAQFVVPFTGVLLLTEALQQSDLPGPIGARIVEALPVFGLLFFVAVWLGMRMFPPLDRAHTQLTLSPEGQAEGRLLSSAGGLLLCLDGLRRILMTEIGASETAISVLSLPVLLLFGLLLIRLAALMRRHVVAESAGDEPVRYATRMVGILARVALAVGVIGPVLAAVGYVSAAQALLLPALVSLALIGLLVILQNFAVGVYAMLMRRPEEEAAKDLVPVLVGFGLSLMALPLFALIWGARTSDLGELWTRFSEGFQLGQTRISPSVFLYFAIIFAVGYFVTRAVQGALRSSILPRTGLDPGGQTAVVSGVGYIGIFLAALIAINSAGIDLSGLAIVAGALSVGIGFGLQTIVSNFVSGIILLIEQPVTEGDWIEVGGVQGTVKNISVRSTRIQTFDRSDVIVPNSDLISGRVTNFTRFSLSGRLIVSVGVAYGSNTRRVEKILQEIAEAQPLALLNPPPNVALVAFGPDAMNFEIRIILRDVNFSLAVRSEINHQIVERFAAEGIEIPYAHRDITLRNIDVLGEALGRSQALAADKAGGSRAAPEGGRAATSDKPKPEGQA